MAKEKPLFTVWTPVPDLGQITLLESGWNHIVKHDDMKGQLENVQDAVEEPLIVYVSPKDSNRLLFVSNTAARRGGKSPLTVIVDAPRQIVCTAFFNRHAEVPKGMVKKWPT